MAEKIRKKKDFQHIIGKMHGLFLLQIKLPCGCDSCQECGGAQDYRLQQVRHLRLGLPCPGHFVFVDRLFFEFIRLTVPGAQQSTSIFNC